MSSVQWLSPSSPIFAWIGGLGKSSSRSKKAAAQPADDFGLYAQLGTSPDVSDAEIQLAYRRRAAAISNGGVGARKKGTLKELNAAYEVLGHPARRAEYDRSRGLDMHEMEIPDLARPANYPRFHHPRTGPRQKPNSFMELIGVLLVMGLSVAAGLFLLQRVSFDLSPVSGLARGLGLGGAAERTVLGDIIPPITAPAPTAAPNAPKPAPISEQFRGTTVGVSNPSPQRNSPVTLLARLQRNGQPASNVDVYAVAQFRTAQERWPNAGMVKSGSDGVASITMNVGDATPNFEVKVTVFAQVDGEQLSWPVSFTPR